MNEKAVTLKKVITNVTPVNVTLNLDIKWKKINLLLS